MHTFTFSSDGLPGEDAVDGPRGIHGRGCVLPHVFTYPEVGCVEEPGGDGGDASEPTRGTDAGTTLLQLESAESGGQVQKGEVYMSGKTFDCVGTPVESCETTVKTSELGQTRLSAVGGKGGDGGRGGMGGTGGEGQKGPPGGYGGFGGRGGNGGRGTSGADGGRGGRVEVRVHEGDEYLLMSVEGLQDESKVLNMARGGYGGRRGSHGQEGTGGKGGAPGDTVKRKKYDPATKTWYSYLKEKTPGQDGKWGRFHASRLTDGGGGTTGQAEIRVLGDRLGMPAKTYARRFDLLLKDFQFDKGDARHLEGLFFFGDSGVVTGLEVVNQGRMPSPAQQRTRLALQDSKWVIADPRDEIFLDCAVDPEGKPVQLEGQLRFSLKYPDDSDTIACPDFDPLLCSFTLSPFGTQLGHETEEAKGRDTLFQRRHENGELTQTGFARFPLQNPKRILGLRSLAPAEKSQIVIPLRNLSNVCLGSEGGGGRRVVVAVSVDPGSKIRGDQIEIEGPDFSVHTLEGTSGIPAGEKRRTVHLHPQPGEGTEGEGEGEEGQLFELPGYAVEVPLLPPKGETPVEFRVRLREDVSPMSSLKLLFWIALGEDVQGEQLGLSSQGRAETVGRSMTVTAEPAFVPVAGAEVVMVTTDRVAKSRYDRWRRVFEELRIQFETFSLTRYAHPGPSLPVLADGGRPLPLMEHFEGKTVVVFNEQFDLAAHTGDSTRADWRHATELLSPLFTRLPMDPNKRTRFLILEPSPDSPVSTRGSHRSESQTGSTGGAFSGPSLRQLVELRVSQPLAKEQRLAGESYTSERDFNRRGLREGLASPHRVKADAMQILPDLLKENAAGIADRIQGEDRDTNPQADAV
uniref:DUF7932 domain-containing protein n=1 Tax=Chromera velia CCMP2878 TaxID=1169474 RepID=A0A0K6S5W5_9ALVE|eukprot:Cvel_15060.t1-p1 / transcript=Cvel_15060.t1 / gene=Cvel_15060 / organism=Chromera_velia_CCMP2878 / gene_product=hypothetical protein / transcript_product=hypothetical protein / location=Cvel_scaffold1097:27723-32311(+) / protein_length=857 / sequence_SO=supercontig / SO=protein_coding / is_pseudo=false